VEVTKGFRENASLLAYIIHTAREISFKKSFEYGDMQ
jgi:hypothetical protein